MPVTSKQLHKIRDIIASYHSAFVVNAVGPEAVAKDVLDKLKAMGLVDIKLASAKDAYLYGQALAAATDPAIANMSFAEFMAHVRKNPVALSDIEKRAATFAQHQAAQYVVGLANKVSTQTGQLLIEADSQLRTKTQAGIRDRTAENIQKRETVKQLKSDLGWMAEDWSRDWDRIAVTEKHTTMQRGLADHYSERFGKDVYVAKRPMPTACTHCKRLHLGDDGQPRIFKLSTLEANGLNNFGRKAADWLAVIGATHPWCQCQMIRVPEGWGFNEEGQMVPGGKLGQHVVDEVELKLSMQREDDLQKAFALQGHINYQGIRIAIENKVGTVRKWMTEEGEQGETRMLHAYGYVKRTNGTDSDEVDVYIGPSPDAPMAFVIHQQNPKTGVYDEDKVMLGFRSQAQAEAAYQAHVDRDDFAITTSPMDIEHFKRWVGSTATDAGELRKTGKLVQKMTLAKASFKADTQPSSFFITNSSPAGNRSPGTGAALANIAARLERTRPEPVGDEVREWQEEALRAEKQAGLSRKVDIEEYVIADADVGQRIDFVVPESWGTLTSEEVARQREAVERLDPNGTRNTIGLRNKAEIEDDD